MHQQADGEVVWSRCLDAGINRPMMLTHRGGDGDKKARSPKRARRKPLKPLCREGRNRFGKPVVTNLRVFYLHARLRVRLASGFPCALFVEGDGS
jgi:hypothetical protein